MTLSTRPGTVTSKQIAYIQSLLGARFRAAAVERLAEHTGYSARTVERRASAQQASELIEQLVEA